MGSRTFCAGITVSRSAATNWRKLDDANCEQKLFVRYWKSISLYGLRHARSAHFPTDTLIVSGGDGARCAQSFLPYKYIIWIWKLHLNIITTVSGTESTALLQRYTECKWAPTFEHAQKKIDDADTCLNVYIDLVKGRNTIYGFQFLVLLCNFDISRTWQISVMLSKSRKPSWALKISKLWFIYLNLDLDLFIPHFQYHTTFTASYRYRTTVS